MVSLFSIFDPVVSGGVGVNWISFFVVFLLPVAFFLCAGSLESFEISFFGSLGVMFSELSVGFSYGVVYLGLVIFVFLFILNLGGLFPFIFSVTSHFVVTMSLGIVMWMSFFLMGWVMNFKNSAAHLVPEGSPLSLSPFMVLIESVSHLIRPFTLSVRLAANMIAGHLIVGLLSSLVGVSMLMGVFSVFLQYFLLLLELGVCFIQGLVFGILLVLYMLEYY